MNQNLVLAENCSEKLWIVIRISNRCKGKQMNRKGVELFTSEKLKSKIENLIRVHFNV